MVKHLYGASFVSKLFFSVVSYIIVLFVYLSSPIWYHLLLTFHTSLFDIWRSERDCRLNVYSEGWTHYSVHSTHCSVGCRHYSIGCTLYPVGYICRLYALLCRLGQCITDRSFVNIYSVGCTHYSVGCAQCSVSCKHILCRLYTLLRSLTFSGKVLKRDSIKNLTITTRGTSTGSVGCRRLQLPRRGSPRFQTRGTLNNEGTLLWSVLKRWNPRSNQITREPSIPLKQGAHGRSVTLHRGETLWPGSWVRIRAEVESEKFDESIPKIWKIKWSAIEQNEVR